VYTAVAFDADLANDTFCVFTCRRFAVSYLDRGLTVNCRVYVLVTVLVCVDWCLSRSVHYCAFFKTVLVLNNRGRVIDFYAAAVECMSCGLVFVSDLQDQTSIT
jgi:hypothetical protein